MMYGADVRARREAAGVTRKQLADRLGFPVYTVGAWEDHGEARVPAQFEAHVDAALTQLAQDKEHR